MTPELQTYSNRDAGYRQFCEQYDLAAGDPETRDEYVLWVKEKMREYGERQAARKEGKAEGRAEADAKWQSVVSEKDAEIAELKAQLDAASNKK